MYKLCRLGKFTTQLVGEVHCSTGVKTPLTENGRWWDAYNTEPFVEKELQYEAYVCVPDGKLDKNGFVFDNKDFKAFFDAQKEVRVSCELLAKQATLHFISLTGNKATEACVKIWGLSGEAYAEYKWVK